MAYNNRLERAGRVRADAFSTRLNVASNRLNDTTWKWWLGRSAGRSRSVAVEVTPLIRRCRARERKPEQPGQARRVDEWDNSASFTAVAFPRRSASSLGVTCDALRHFGRAYFSCAPVWPSQFGAHFLTRLLGRCRARNTRAGTKISATKDK